MKSLSKYIKPAVFAVLVLQFAYIVFLNLFKSQGWIDHDGAMLYTHTINMWNQRSFILPFYSEQTYFDFDTSALLAMPLYGLINNIFLAYGIANVVFLSLTLYVMNDLLKKYKVNDIYRYVAMIIYLIPYRIGLDEYTNMLFYECSFYNICILITVLAVDLFISEQAEETGRKYYILMALYAVLIVLSAISRGTYMMLMALLPVLVCYALEVILSTDGFKHIRRSKIILIAVTIISYVLGMGIARIIGAEPNVTGYSLVLPQEIFDNFVDVFWGHLSVFMDRTDPSVFSAEGIRYLVLLGFAIFMIIVLVFNLKHAFSDEDQSNRLRFLTIIYVWEICILGLTNVSNSIWAFPERYLFPGLIPLMLSVPIMLSYMEKIERVLLRGVLYIVIAVLTILTIGVADIGILKSFKVSAEDTSAFSEVIAYARDNGVNTIYFLNDADRAWVARSMAPDLKIADVDGLEEGGFTVRSDENYICARDRAFYDDDNLLAVRLSEQPEAYLDEYLLSSYKEVASVKDYHLYRSGENKFDGIAGFPMKDNVMDRSIDFCYTEGYQAIGETDLYGHLVTTGFGDYVLLSSAFTAPYATTDVTLSYSTEESGKIGELRLLDESLRTISSVDITGGSEEAVITVEPAGTCYLAVWLDNDRTASIGRIDFKVR